MRDPAVPGRLQVRVVYSPRAGQVVEVALELPAGATAAQAVQASGLPGQHPEIDLRHTALGIWGRRCRPDAPLRDQDRVELYRPLSVDPKEARRLRFRRQREDGPDPARPASGRSRPR